MINQAIEVLENQLSQHSPQCTSDTLESLCEAGIDQAEGKDFLAGMLSLQIYGTLITQQPFDEILWKENLERMSKRVIAEVGNATLTQYQMEKNIARMRKDVGFIVENHEMEYHLELNTLESTLFSFQKMYQINSKMAKKVVLQVCNRLYGYIQGKEYDFFTDQDKEVYLLADLLEEKCNPYLNPILHDFLKNKVNLDHSEDRRIFTPMVKCCERIYRSIDFWEKKFGSDGYFSFLSTCEDEMFQSDPNMAFTEITLKKR